MLIWSIFIHFPIFEQGVAVTKKLHYFSIKKSPRGIGMSRLDKSVIRKNASKALNFFSCVFILNNTQTRIILAVLSQPRPPSHFAKRRRNSLKITPKFVFLISVVHIMWTRLG